MDVDDENSFSPQTDYLVLFDLTPQQFPWKDTRPQEIRARRALLKDQLFFDILLRVGNIQDTATLYPPTDVVSLRRLLDAIDGATYDSMKKDCLIYYLLKWHGDGREARYAEGRCISPHYASIADAYWHLDTGDRLSRAISLLSDARIVKECTSKIIDVLSLAQDSKNLILKYIRTCKPAVTEFEDLRRYMFALAESDLMEAWQFQRTFPERSEPREGLLRKLMDWALMPAFRKEGLKRLLALPFTSYEESVVRDYAISSPSHLSESSAGLLRDFVAVRLIQSNKYVEAVKFDRQYARTSVGPRGSWSSERKRILDEIVSAMPAAQRAMLEDELNGSSQSESHPAKPSVSGSNGSWTNVSGSSDLGASWEDLAPKSSTNGLGSSERKAKLYSDAPMSSSLGHSTQHPRRNLAGASRQEAPLLSNGLSSTRNMFTPGASTSFATHQTLSGQPTLLSQSASSLPPINAPRTSTTTFGFPSSTPTVTPTRFGPLPPSSSTATVPLTMNGTAQKMNGATPPRTNGFLTRNAFYNPPVVDTDMQPFDRITNFSIGSKASPPRQTVERPESSWISEQKLPGVEDDALSVEGDPMTAHSDAASIVNEKEELNFPLFGRSSLPTPPIDDMPVPQAQQSRVVSEQKQRLLPGAFVSDAEDETEHLSLPARYSKARPSTSPQRSEMLKNGKSSSRKRAASPVEEVKVIIPGTLFEEDEEAEEENTVPPLQQSKKSTSRASTNAKRPARKARSSRGSSVDPGETEPGRPVRRSTRLSAAPSVEAKPVKERPRKSTRTAGPGATATGRGSAKKK